LTKRNAAVSGRGVFRFRGSPGRPAGPARCAIGLLEFAQPGVCLFRIDQAALTCSNYRQTEFVDFLLIGADAERVAVALPKPAWCIVGKEVDQLPL
jgi:hypothetical protein